MPPNAKITAEVWSGRRRPKLVHGKSKFNAGQASWEAINSPTENPAIPQNIAITAEKPKHVNGKEARESGPLCRFGALPRWPVLNCNERLERCKSGTAADVVA